MLLNINFKHAFTISFDYAYSHISRKQNKRDVDTVEDNSLKHRSFFHKINLSYINLSYIENGKIHTVHHNIGKNPLFE